MSRTLPQIVLLNHAAWVEGENTKRKMDAEREGNTDTTKVRIGKKTYTADEVANNDELKEQQMNQFLSFLGGV